MEGKLYLVYFHSITETIEIKTIILSQGQEGPIDYNRQIKLLADFLYDSMCDISIECLKNDIEIY